MPDPMGQGHDFVYWIGATLGELRTCAGLSRRYIADVLGVDERKVRRLEGTDGPQHQSYNNIDRVIAAYALALGIEDPRDLWQMALSRWMRSSERPVFPDLQLPDREFLTPIQQAAQRRQQSRSGRKGKPSASTSRRAA